MNPVQTNTPRTPNQSAIAAILADPFDDPMFNKITRVAHEVLKQVPGAAADPFMITSLATFGKRTLVTASCFYHTVVFLNKSALVLSREEGGMIPWVKNETLCVPDVSFFDMRVRLPEGVAQQLANYFADLAAAEHGETDAPVMSC